MSRYRNRGSVKTLSLIIISLSTGAKSLNCLHHQGCSPLESDLQNAWCAVILGTLLFSVQVFYS